MAAREPHFTFALKACLLFSVISILQVASALDSPNLPHANQDDSLEPNDARVIFAGEQSVAPKPYEAVNKRIRLTTGQSYFPFISAKMPHGGWSQALVTRTFAEMGLNVDIHVLPWSRGERWTTEQRFLGTFPYVYSAKRAKKYYFSKPINFIPVRFYVSQASNFTDVQQLKNKRLCLPYGYSADFVKDGVVDSLNLKINRVVDGAACIGHVQRGWSDAGLTNDYVSVNEVNNDRLTDSKLVVLKKDVEQVPLHFIISTSYPEARKWMDKFDRAFQRLIENGAKAEIDDQFTQLLDSN